MSLKMEHPTSHNESSNIAGWNSCDCPSARVCTFYQFT